MIRLQSPRPTGDLSGRSGGRGGRSLQTWVVLWHDGTYRLSMDKETLYSLLKVALSIAGLLAILGLLVVACVRGLRTLAREFWPH